MVTIRHNPTRNSTSPPHSINGGFGLNSLGIITEPSINWKSSADDEYGVQSYGSAIADFSDKFPLQNPLMKDVERGIYLRLYN